LDADAAAHGIPTIVWIPSMTEIEQLKDQITDLRESLGYEENTTKQLFRSIEKVYGIVIDWESGEIDEPADALDAIKDELDSYFTEPDV
jgi:predicted RNA-binding protein with EMAP domain